MRCILGLLYFLFVLVVSSSSQCSNLEFPCEDKGCIDAILWCDTREDCIDGSDERYCRKSGRWIKDPNKCSSAYFKCGDGPCIPIVGRCDGYLNCQDYSDEKGCNLDSSFNNGSASPTSILTSSPWETKMTLAKTPLTPVFGKNHQLSVKLDSQAGYSSDAADSIQYSDLLSDYSHQREMARTWLLSQRKRDFGWGAETPRAVTALFLSEVQPPAKRSESDMLMVKQLEVQLSLDMARNGTKAMELTNLALYINALMASCKDPKNFYGENLVSTLRNGVDVARRKAPFVYPSVYLTLCLNNASTYDDARQLHDIFSSRNAAFGRIDIEALALLTTTCIFQDTNHLGASQYEGLKKQFLNRIKTVGLPGNVYEAALLVQVLKSLQVDQPDLLEFILKQQLEDGSFGGILATYLVLPVLAGRSFLQMDDHCDQRYFKDLAPIEVLKNSKRRKIFVQYSLNYGNPSEMKHTIQMQVAEGINFLDVMRLAQEGNPKYRFLLDDNRDVPVVYSIGGIPNDAEKGMFWTLHIAPKGDQRSLSPYSGNIKELIPHASDEFVFWMRSM